MVQYLQFRILEFPLTDFRLCIRTPVVSRGLVACWHVRVGRDFRRRTPVVVRDVSVETMAEELEELGQVPDLVMHEIGHSYYPTW